MHVKDITKGFGDINNRQCLEKGICLDNIKTGPVTGTRPFCVTPEIVEKPDKPVLEQDLIMKEQDEQKSVSSLLFT